MKLTDKQKEITMKKLNEFWTNRKCDSCGSNDWILDEVLYQIVEYHGIQVVLGKGALKPLLLAACSKCGNVKYFDAIRLGVVDVKNPSCEEKGGSNE